MISRQDEKDPRKRILSACVRMFIERGFRATTMHDILREADVSAGTFQNAFRTKDGVLFSLVGSMFDLQFSMARAAWREQDDISVYAIETAVQLAIAEHSENLREIYAEAYTQPGIYEYIRRKTAVENRKFFAPYNKEWDDSDFYEAEIGSSGMMYAFMAQRCDVYFTLQRKTERFLRMAFDVYHVPAAEAERALSVLRQADIAHTADAVMARLFSTLEMAFDFKFSKTPGSSADFSDLPRPKAL